MSVTLFELPPPGELGNGWSLRFLTAAQMLECRGEGEARAGEERDKALWANAALLSRVLLKEGEPAFPDGEAVLASLTVGQIDGLARRWWEQDDFSGLTLREEGSAWEKETVREGSENEHFDMARFLALGGEMERTSRDFAGEGTIYAGSSGLSGFPEIWPGRTLPQRVPAAERRVYREPDINAGAAMPYTGEAAVAEDSVPLSRRGAGTAEPSGEEHSAVKVLLPESVQAEPGLTVEELDRTVERDARRYDGGLTLM